MVQKVGAGHYEERRMSRTEWIGLLTMSVLASFLFVRLPHFTVDDAFILFRYANHLAEYGELNWNVGEDPVEGYTGVFFVALLAGFQKLGISPLLASKVIGIGSFFLTGSTLYSFALVLGLRTWVRLTVAFLYFAAPFMYTNAISGLETTLFAAAVTASIFALYLTLATERNPGRSQVLLMLSLLITSLVRPEGVVLAVFALSAVSHTIIFHDRSPWRGFVFRVFCAYVLPAATYFLWRWDYYGKLLPNTFYAKVSEHFSLDSFWGFESFIMFLAIPAALAAVLLAGDPRRVVTEMRGKGYRVLRALTLSGAVAVAFILLVTALYMRTHLIMNFSHRFFVPFFPLLILFTAILMNAGWSVLDEEGDKEPIRRRYLTAMLVGLLVLQASVYARALPDEFRYTAIYSQTMSDEHIKLGKWLRERVPISEWLIVHSDGGAIPYYSELRTIDCGLLNDETLGALSDGARIDYLYSFKPGVIVMTSYSMDELRHTEEATRIVSDPRFANYVLVKKYGSSAKENYCQFLFLRKDLTTKE